MGLGALERDRRKEERKDFLGAAVVVLVLKLRVRWGVLGIDGRRGAVDGSEEGTLGRSMDGAGLGEGIVRNESLGIGDGTRPSAILVMVQFLEALEDAFRFRLAERRDWDSARSSDRNERNWFWSRLGCMVK